MLQTGDKAPAFSLPDQDDVAVSLADYQGKWVILFFYPSVSVLIPPKVIAISLLKKDWG